VTAQFSNSLDRAGHSGLLDPECWILELSHNLSPIPFTDVTADGLVAIPAGARVIGVVTEAVPLKRIGGRARLGLELDRLVLPDGSEQPISAALAEASRSETGKDAATIGGAAAGAILGRATAGRSDREKSTIIGTLLGAAAGTVIASRTEGEEITIPEGTFVTLALDQPLRLTVER